MFYCTAGLHNLPPHLLRYTINMQVPENPKLFHIVHVDHLASVIGDGRLFSDAIMSTRSDYGTNIGMEHIKERRMKIPVYESGKGFVGEHVPFYFRPRSMMLYPIYKRTHKDITYRGGQRNVIHLVSNVNDAISWANKNKKTWAFSDRNASIGHVKFYYDRADLSKLRWDVMAVKDFSRDSEVREVIQSEFLVRDSFAWELINEIAVYDEAIRRQVGVLLENAKHKPIVTVHKEWYY